MVVVKADENTLGGHVQVTSFVSVGRVVSGISKAMYHLPAESGGSVRSNGFNGGFGEDGHGAAPLFPTTPSGCSDANDRLRGLRSSYALPTR